MYEDYKHTPTALLFYLQRSITTLWYLAIALMGWEAIKSASSGLSPTVTLPFEIGVGISPEDKLFPENFVTVDGKPQDWTRFYGHGKVRVLRSSIDPGVGYAMDAVTLFMLLAFFSAFWRIKALLSNAVSGDFFGIRNAIHMRWLGWSLLMIPVLAFAAEWGLRYSGYSLSHGTRVDIIGWFPGTAVLVLGEVFLAGAKLEAERQLTI